MPIFCFNFNFVLIHFLLLQFLFPFFNTITLFYFIFVVCRQLQCWHSCQNFVMSTLVHSCQYFIWTSILFLISFSVTSFSISIFLFNNFILYYFYCCVDNCNVDTHAKNIPSLRVHMYCAQGPDQFSVHSLYSTDNARTTAWRAWRHRLSTNQGSGKFERTEWQNLGLFTIGYIFYKSDRPKCITLVKMIKLSKKKE